MTFRAAICLLVATVCGSLASYAQKTYIVAVGLNNYQNGENPLPCSINDAQSISNFFYRIADCDVHLLQDSNATRDHILSVLKSMAAKTTPQDEIIFAYSGHGFDGGVSCYDTGKFIYCTEIQQILRKAKAGRKLMFINSCHSGSFSKKPQTNNNTQNYRQKNIPVLLFLSSRANELSWENTGMKHSYFFTWLINGLKGGADVNGDKKVTARELFNYVYKNVIDDTRGKQHPQMYGHFPDDMVIVHTN